MTLLSGEKISRQFQDQRLFEDLSFSVNEGDRIGMVGPNGIGKTTLFEIITGRVLCEDGQVFRAKNCRISYVEQEFAGDPEVSLFDFVCTSRQDLVMLHREIDAVAHELEKDPQASKIIERLGDLQHRFEVEGGYDFEAEVKIILAGLGFPPVRQQERLGNFSGGERNRASLARVLAAPSDLLLLDEPTNHLDLDSTIWLEEYLKGLSKTYIVVSHDRAFLNVVVKKIWEISGRKIVQYFGDFETYLKEREERRRLQLHHYRHQQEEIKKIEDFIRRNMAGQKTKQAQSRQKYLTRIKRIELPAAEKEGPSFSVQAGQRSFSLVLQAENAAVGYDGEITLAGIDFKIYRGQRVGLIGPNGSGKSTLLRTVIGEKEPLVGEIRLGQKVDMAYFDQELADLNENNTVLDEIWQEDPMAEPGRLRSFLARFGFRGEDAFKKVAVLSGGEKTKLALARLLFHPANFLIFDEPTNHLDIDARQALEEALQAYTGTYLVVSHDRYFLDRIAERIFAIEYGTVRIYDGGYSAYRARKDSLATAAGREVSPGRKKEYVDFKEASRAKSRLKKEFRGTQDKIEKLEKEVTELESELLYRVPKSDWGRLLEISAEKSRIEEELLSLYERLEELEKLNVEDSDTERQSG